VASSELTTRALPTATDTCHKLGMSVIEAPTHSSLVTTWGFWWALSPCMHTKKTSSTLFGCACIHLNPHVLKWNWTKFYFIPLQHIWIEVDTHASKQALLYDKTPVITLHCHYRRLRVPFIGLVLQKIWRRLLIRRLVAFLDITKETCLLCFGYLCFPKVGPNFVPHFFGYSSG
jgi:hypothetical protein